MASYFTNVGPTRGPWRYQDSAMAGAVGVLQAPDRHMPIGMALGVGPDADGIAFWRLTVHGVELPGLFAVIDRQFWAAGSE